MFNFTQIHVTYITILLQIVMPLYTNPSNHDSVSWYIKCLHQLWYMQVVSISGGILEPVSGAVLQLKGALTVFVASTPPWVTIMNTIY